MICTSRSAPADVYLTGLGTIGTQLQCHHRLAATVRCYTKDTAISIGTNSIPTSWTHGRTWTCICTTQIPQTFDFSWRALRTVHFNTGEYYTISYFLLSSRFFMSPYTFPKAMHNAMHESQINHLRKYHSPTPTNTTALTNLPVLFKIRLF